MHTNILIPSYIQYMYMLNFFLYTYCVTLYNQLNVAIMSIQVFSVHCIPKYYAVNAALKLVTF